MAGNSRTLTQAELLALLQERFGTDPMDWAFKCPSCGDVATARAFTEALAARPRDADGDAATASDLLGRECIGRVLGALAVKAADYKGRGCDWCAYGLFGGPWTITLPEGGEMRCFPVAPAPAEARNG